MVVWRRMPGANQPGEEPRRAAKPYGMAQGEVWEAEKQGKATPGAAGVDAPTMADVAQREQATRSKSWHRMSAGRDCPPPGRTVKLPQAHGGERTLGRPTVSERIAPRVVQTRLEPAVDPRFPPDAEG